MAWERVVPAETKTEGQVKVISPTWDVVQECEVEERVGTPGSVENDGEEPWRTGLQK